MYLSTWAIIMGTTISHDLQISCWFDAIRNNHHEAITAMYRVFGLDINDNTSYEEYSATPMHIAADTNNEDTIRLVALLGGNVNSTDYYGDTPLYRSIANDAMTSIRVLLELGADLYASCVETTPIHLIRLKQDGNLYELVVPYTKGHKRWKKIQVYAKVIGKMMRLYYRSIENVWRPGGVGYHLARIEFQHLISV